MTIKMMRCWYMVWGKTSGFLFRYLTGTVVWYLKLPILLPQDIPVGMGMSMERQPPGVYYWKVEGHTDTEIHYY